MAPGMLSSSARALRASSRAPNLFPNTVSSFPSRLGKTSLVQRSFHPSPLSGAAQFGGRIPGACSRGDLAQFPFKPIRGSAPARGMSNFGLPPGMTFEQYVAEHRRRMAYEDLKSAGIINKRIEEHPLELHYGERLTPERLEAWLQESFGMTDRPPRSFLFDPTTGEVLKKTGERAETTETVAGGSAAALQIAPDAAGLDGEEKEEEPRVQLRHSYFFPRLPYSYQREETQPILVSKHALRELLELLCAVVNSARAGGTNLENNRRALLLPRLPKWDRSFQALQLIAPLILTQLRLGDLGLAQYRDSVVLRPAGPRGRTWELVRQEHHWDRGYHFPGLRRPEGLGLYLGEQLHVEQGFEALGFRGGLHVVPEVILSPGFLDRERWKFKELRGLRRLSLPEFLEFWAFEEFGSSLEESLFSWTLQGDSFFGEWFGCSETELYQFQLDLLTDKEFSAADLLRPDRAKQLIRLSLENKGVPPNKLSVHMNEYLEQMESFLAEELQPALEGRSKNQAEDEDTFRGFECMGRSPVSLEEMDKATEYALRSVLGVEPPKLAEWTHAFPGNAVPKSEALAIMIRVALLTKGIRGNELLSSSSFLKIEDPYKRTSERLPGSRISEKRPSAKEKQARAFLQTQLAQGILRPEEEGKMSSKRMLLRAASLALMLQLARIRSPFFGPWSKARGKKE